MHRKEVLADLSRLVRRATPSAFAPSGIALAFRALLAHNPVCLGRGARDDVDSYRLLWAFGTASANRPGPPPRWRSPPRCSTSQAQPGSPFAAVPGWP